MNTIDLEDIEASNRWDRRREAYRRWHVEEFGCEPDEQESEEQDD